MTVLNRSLAALLALSLTLPGVAHAHAYREKGKAVTIGNSTLSVTPPRDWNRLDVKAGKHAETWTLDGEQLNEVTFFTEVAPGEPLVRERDRKREPLPKLTGTTLLAEIPELLEGTYRAYKHTGAFNLTGSQPETFLGAPGVYFTYEYTDADQLPRKGEARAALIKGKLYMATFDAPRLHFFDDAADDYRSLVATATLAAAP